MKRKCEICSEEFNNKQKLYEHLKDHISDAENDVFEAEAQMTYLKLKHS